MMPGMLAGLTDLREKSDIKPLDDPEAINFPQNEKVQRIRSHIVGK
jgi:hypothetical protein